MKRGMSVLIAAALVAASSGVGSAFAQSGTEAKVYVDGLDFPTNMAYAPDGRIFVTEKETGKVLIIKDGQLLPKPFVQVSVFGGAERGLLGIALHPDFENEPWVYLYLSDGGDHRNRIIRIRADGDRGTTRENVIDLLPADAGYHNGGDIAFGPDGMLYAVTGETHEADRAQVADDLGGKILRLTPQGKIPPDNPFGPSSPVYTLGHRNSFGLCFDHDTGQLWETENGPDSHDEINRIQPGKNYGWPVVSGPGGGSRFVDPALDFPQVEALTGCAVANGTLWFGTYGSAKLHHARIDGDALTNDLSDDVGSVTDVMFAPDGYLYFTTSSGIKRLRVAAASPSPSVSPTPVGPTAQPSPTSTSRTPQDAQGKSNPVSIVIIAILLALGIVVMRGRIRPPEPPA